MLEFKVELEMAPKATGTLVYRTPPGVQYSRVPVLVWLFSWVTDVLVDDALSVSLSRTVGLAVAP